MNEFLKLEYEQCIGLIKYYDERHQALAKFAAGLSAAVPAFGITIMRFGPDGIKADAIPYLAFLSFMTFIGLLVVYTSMVQNRLYFVYPAKQVNSIRGLMEKELKNEGFHNQMYTKTDFGAWKWMSSQTLLLIFVAIQAGVFFGFSCFPVFVYFCMISNASPSAILSAVTASTALVCFAWRYLSNQGVKAPDASVHGENK